ncbi:MAG: carboxypeptidase regulatory-like domain-containing protein [Acidobacteria bacterium]|nr:carboxypeptidase regulatory-like domain-containing protein [Acidobacteriota bacterium]
MSAILRKLALGAAAALLAAGGAWAQTSSIEGDVKGEDGNGLRGALVKIERKDIKGNYKVKSDKKGHFFHAGLPLGMYKVILEVEGKDVDTMDNVRTRLGDPTVVNFDLSALKRKRDALQRAAETGQLTAEQAREMTPEQRAAMDKQMKERQAAMAKNKALNDAFNVGMDALKARQFDAAVESFAKASEMDPKQHVVWAQLAEAYVGLGTTKTGAEQDAIMAKGLEAYGKAMELKPDDAGYHNNYALALAKAKKFPEAQAELTKAAQIDPPNAGRYFYNLGAVLVNIGQLEPAGEAFKKAIETDPNYADAQYQYGVYLISKATTTPDGRITPLEGTKEAFQKYLQLKPDGPFAESAKGMLASFDAAVQTEYRNPNAPPAQKKAAKKK